MFHLINKVPLFFLIVFFLFVSPISATGTDSLAANVPTLERNGKNAIYVEMLGSAMNIVSLNYERSIKKDLHVRLGGSYFGFSTQLRYEDRGDDLFLRLATIPVSVSHTFFNSHRQLELGVGFTYLSFSFDGGPFDGGYRDIELGNNYRGLALTGIVGYRLSVHNYLFRLGISPHYMFTVDSEITGFFNELEDRGEFSIEDFLDFRGFRLVPGLSFGKTF